MTDRILTKMHGSQEAFYIHVLANPEDWDKTPTLEEAKAWAMAHTKPFCKHCGQPIRKEYFERTDGTRPWVHNNKAQLDYGWQRCLGRETLAEPFCKEGVEIREGTDTKGGREILDDVTVQQMIDFIEGPE